MIASAPFASFLPLAANAADEITTTILDAGDVNSPLPEPRQSVVVEYTLWLNGFGGQRIDGNGAFTFRVGTRQVIKGWDITVSQMHVGERRRVVIPPSLGYGSEPIGPIPRDSPLYFEIALKELKPTQAQMQAMAEAKEKAAAATRTPQEQEKLDRAARMKQVRAERMQAELDAQGEEYLRVGVGKNTFGSTISVR